MKKIVTLVLCMITFTTFGQLKLGVEAGYNIAQFTQKGSNQQYYHLSNINSFQAGLVVEQKLNKHFFLGTGLSYTVKGSEKYTTQFANDGASTTIKLNYLQLPLNLIYKIKICPSTNILLGAGLYGAIGISGTDKGVNVVATVPVSNINNKVKFSDNTSTVENGITYVKPFDMGYNLLAGIECKRFQFKATLNKGFKSVYPTGSTTFYNSVYSATVAYLVPWN